MCLNHLERPLWNTLIAVLLCAMLSAPAGATAIVAVRTPEAIVIAADSLLTVKGGKQSPGPHLECKIVEIAGVVFTLTGFAADPAHSFDLRDVIRAALAGNEPPTSADFAVAVRTVAALKDELARLKRENPDLYQQLPAERGAPLVKVLLAAYENETPWVSLLIFSRSGGQESDNVTVSRKNCPGDCSPDSVNALFLADTGPIEKALRAKNISWERPEQAAKTLVEQVIGAGTPGVGPPIDLVRIDRAGISWIERKPECGEVEDHGVPVGKGPGEGDEEDPPPLRTR